MAKKINQDLVAFAAEAKARHMTYGQLQQLETLEMIKRQNAKQAKEKQEGKE